MNKSTPRMFGDVRADFPAGLVVFFVAVPLCLGIALASGAPLFSGLIAGILGGILVGALSGSALGVSGPAAGLAVIVLHAIGELGFEAFLLAVALAGVFQIVLGLLHAGVLGYFFPSSVIQGMLAGIGVIIILKQIPHALGYDSDPEGELAFMQPDGNTTFSALESMFANMTASAALIGSVSLVILITWERFFSKKRFAKLIQGPLVVVAFGIAFQWITSALAPSWSLSPEHLVEVPVADSIGGFFSFFTHPDWSQLSNSAVWLTALTLAIVASLETLLCVEATDKLDPLKRVTPTSRELLAQGVGNTCSGLIGGLPITQVIVRSSANVHSGGRTKLSAILHGFLLLLFVAILPNLLNLIPLAALASILLVVGTKLAKPSMFRRMYALGPDQSVPFAATVVGVVFTDLLTGVCLGLAVSLFTLLQRSYRNSHCLEKVPCSVVKDREVVTLRLAEEASFLNRGAILRTLKLLPDGARVIIDGSHCFSIDHDVVETIEDFLSTTERRGIEVECIGDFLKEPRPEPELSQSLPSTTAS